MITGAWIDRRWWWLPMLALVIINLTALVWYGLVHSGYAKRVDQQLESRRADLQRLESTLDKQRQVAERLQFNESKLTDFYTTRLAPPSERLTEVIREVRGLARTAGLQPAAIDYPDDQLAEYGLIKRSFSFGVRGSYSQLRRFIHLLEMTDSFLTLEEVQLTGRGDKSELRMSMRLSTLFVQDAAPGSAGEAAS